MIDTALLLPFVLGAIVVLARQLRQTAVYVPERPRPIIHPPSDLAEPRGGNAKKRVALKACLSAAEEYREEQPGLTASLLVKVGLWAADQGAEAGPAWAVYFRLGALKVALGEPLLFDPEAAVLAAIAEADVLDEKITPAAP